MARLSDFHKPAAPIEQKTLDVMERNARAAGFRTNWKATKINSHKMWGSEPFKEAEKLAKTSMAMDEEKILRTARRMAMHIALDAALDEPDAEPEEEDEDAEPEEESEQRSQGGGCGKSYACDVGWLTQKAAQEFRRGERQAVPGPRYAVV
jgi:hypothetical protein